MITPEQIDAINRLINSKGFALAACFVVLGGVLWYLINPIPSKMDEILTAVREGCGRTHQERIAEVQR